MQHFQELAFAEAQAITEAYLRTRPAALARFAQRWAESGRPPFAGTVDQADDLQQWFSGQLEEAPGTQQAALPLWFRGTVEESEAETPAEDWMTAERLWLADDVAAALEAILTRAVPSVRWECFTRIKSEGDMRKHKPMLVIGDPAWPVEPPPWQIAWMGGSHALHGRHFPLWKPLSWTERFTEEVDRAWRWWAKQGVDRAAWEAARA